VSADVSHIRPEVRREVEDFLDLRGKVHELEVSLRASFARRLAVEGLTVSEMAMVTEALERGE
jgi:hypothetical protein